MKTYMLLIMGSGDGIATLSEDDRNTHMAKWFAWDKELADSGVKVSGEALQADGSKLISGKNMKVADGFFCKNMECVVGGYYLIKAEDMETAVEIAKGSPTFELDGNIEVREVMFMDK